ncbi:conserved membrane hypothetical protein [Arthrobacter sp. 9V]|uniref:YoaK family protein n=1 Tax=Arthrobacter sp. 9V TaxID=2653132 RepID=UPI0012F031DD|nr:YoaK family protein [Arthrobacter sp. 9V]VXB47344.1 conserved membrane hypothetical protein [Arthrobacter sp. 9V]
MKARNRPKVATIHLWLMLGLTFSTGVADAVGYLGLDKVFTGNMTGNVVILGMALAGADGLPIVGPAVALGGFMAGAAIAGRALRGLKAAWSAVTTGILLGVGLALTALAVYLGLESAGAPELSEIAVAAVMATTMGAQAAAARHLGVKDVTTVVVTSTITGLSADSWLAARISQPWPRRLLAVLLISAGAAVGAVLLTVHLALGIALSAAITLVAAVVGHLSGRPTPVPESQTQVAAL